MNAAIVLIISIVVLLAGYICYGGWLSKQWGIDPSRKTPAHELEDGIDYVPAKAPVLMGHHFSSIAGAGPINGPIQAAAFGWVPVLLWVLIGGIFFGSVHDFGALFASVRHNGQSIGEVIDSSMGKTAKRLFITFAYLTLLLVVAAFASIVAGTFGATNAAGKALEGAALEANLSTAMISLLFIVLAIIFGYMVYRKNMPIGPATACGIVGIVIIVALGLNFHPVALSYNVWMWVLGLYILVASVAPVWILLQPRDYLSSFLLYAMLFIAFLAVVLAHPSMSAMPTAEIVVEGASGPTFLFPVLFTTIACGAISGFHSLVSSGTTSKQLDKESDAQPIAYGGMLIECVLAILTLCAVGYAYKWNQANPDAALKGATAIFGGGIAHMVDDVIPGTYQILYTLLVLTYSAFCLTSLDTATRLARFMFQEFWLDGSKGETPETVTGYKKVLTNPLVATLITVFLGIMLGLNGYAKIWALFGSANQLLAALGLLAVATWLGNIGKDNGMFLFPMGFMLIVTIASLIINTKNQFAVISAGGADWGPWVQAILGILLVILALVLAHEGIQTISNTKKKAA